MLMVVNSQTVWCNVKICISFYLSHESYAKEIKHTGLLYDLKNLFLCGDASPFEIDYDACIVQKISIARSSQVEKKNKKKIKEKLVLPWSLKWLIQREGEDQIEYERNIRCRSNLIRRFIKDRLQTTQMMKLVSKYLIMEKRKKKDSKASTVFAQGYRIRVETHTLTCHVLYFFYQSHLSLHASYDR